MATYGYSQSNQTYGMIPGMMGVYNQTLGLNEQNYANILGTYGRGAGQLAATLPGIYGGYGQLQSAIGQTLGVTGGGWGVAAPAAQAIQQTFAQTQGQTRQQMINAGLGNTTVGANISNQNALMASQAYAGLGAQLAQTYAGYEAQIGLAGLGAQMQGAGMQAQMAQATGSTLGGQKFGNTAGQLAGPVGGSSSYQTGGGPGGVLGAGANAYDPAYGSDQGGASAVSQGYGAPVAAGTAPAYDPNQSVDTTGNDIGNWSGIYGSEDTGYGDFGIGGGDAMAA